jgi:hypothetical protein
MNVPHYVNENKSDMRGVKPGWYAIADDGHLFSGPFLSREECLRRLTDSSHGPMSPGMLSRPIWDAYTAEMKQLSTDIPTGAEGGRFGGQKQTRPFKDQVT